MLGENPELKARINEKIGPFNSPAITNVRSVAMMDVLLDAGADIDAKSSWWAGGFGLLHTCDEAIAKAAIERGAKVDAHAAARLGMRENLEKLINEDPKRVNERGGDGQTPLHFASTVEIAECLLDHGADIDVRDVDHESTPAQYMAGSRQEIARFLVSRGCQTDILMASALGDLDLVRSIVTKDPKAIWTRVGSDFFPMKGLHAGGTIYQWELGWYVSAAQVARRFRHEEVFDFLWESSPAELNLVNACLVGDSAKANGLLSENPKLADKLPEAEKRQVAHAARNNDAAAVRLLLRAGLPVDARSQHKATILHWAAYHGNLEMIQAVLPYNPPLEDRQNDYKGSPLDWAIHGSMEGWYVATGDYPACVKALLDAGTMPPESLGGSEAVRSVLSTHGVMD